MQAIKCELCGSSDMKGVFCKMKKITATICVLILFVCSVAIAEDYTIKFAGLDWLITPEEAIEQMKSDGYQFADYT